MSFLRIETFNGFKLFCAIIVAALLVKTDTLQSIGKSINETFRLPNTSIPLHYDIHLKTNIHREDLNYTGNCSIVVKVIETTDQLVLHANLSIDEVHMTDFQNEKIKETLKFELEKEKSFLILKRFNFNDEVRNFERGQKLRLSIKFHGVINTSQEGFQNITYKNSEGREIMGAFTLFQPNTARLAYPCYDEPALKARFVLRITHGSNMTALSNMPQDGDLTKHDDGMVTTNFKESYIMSTYLLAFVLTDFKYSQLNSEGLALRYFSANGSDEHNVLENQAWGFKTMKKLFHVPHDLQKLDSISVSTIEGGMENWGLFLYNFEEVLCAADDCSVSDAGCLQYLIFHEFCHHWFGNLVTAEWWTYLWLNEGFATYYGFVLTDLRSPQYRFLDFLTADTCMPQLMTHVNGTMSKYVDKIYVDELFSDEIPYGKAPCIIQMFEHAFGQQAFRDGVSVYLKANVYSTVTEDDLFDAIQHAMLKEGDLTSQPWNYSVNEIMKSWTHNEHYPEVIVKRDYNEKNSNIIRVQQTSKSKEKFWIPLTFATASNPNFENRKADYFLSPYDEEAIIDLKSLNITLKPDDWLIVNKNAIGYYTVKYDDENLKRLSKKLLDNRESISPLSRATLYSNIGDIEKKDLNLKILKNISILDLELIKSLKDEDDAIVWLVAAKRFNYMPIFNKNQFKLLRSYLRTIIEPQYERFHQKSSTLRSTSELFMFKELERLARDLDLETAINDRDLTNLYLKNMKSVLDDIDAEENTNEFNDFICRAVKNTKISDFKDVIHNFRKHVKNCTLWTGLLCSQHEDSMLYYFENFFEQFKHGDEFSHDAECNCRLQNTASFLSIDFTTTWDRAWKINNDVFRSNRTCSQQMAKSLINKFDNISMDNLEKFQDAFKDIEEINYAYEERKNSIQSEDDVTKWLKKELNISYE